MNFMLLVALFCVQGIALQMSPLVAAAPPTCVMANNITTFTTTVPFSFVDPSSLTFSITENVSWGGSKRHALEFCADEDESRLTMDLSILDGSHGANTCFPNPWNRSTRALSAATLPSTRTTSPQMATSAASGLRVSPCHAVRFQLLLLSSHF